MSFDNPTRNSNSGLPHPPQSLDDEWLKQHLLSLSKHPELAAHRSTLRSAADRVREKAFGYNRATTKRKILKLVKEYFCLELEDIVDETRIAEKEVKAAIAELLADGKLKKGRRRRWQEPGKHFNDTYELVTL
jgi:hypothetical protein